MSRIRSVSGRDKTYDGTIDESIRPCCRCGKPSFPALSGGDSCQCNIVSASPQAPDRQAERIEVVAKAIKPTHAAWAYYEDVAKHVLADLDAFDREHPVERRVVDCASCGAPAGYPSAGPCPGHPVEPQGRDGEEGIADAVALLGAQNIQRQLERVEELKTVHWEVFNGLSVNERDQRRARAWSLLAKADIDIVRRAVEGRDGEDWQDDGVAEVEPPLWWTREMQAAAREYGRSLYESKLGYGQRFKRIFEAAGVRVPLSKDVQALEGRDGERPQDDETAGFFCVNCGKRLPSGDTVCGCVVEGRDGEDTREWSIWRRSATGVGADGPPLAALSKPVIVVPKATRDARDAEIERLKQGARDDLELTGVEGGEIIGELTQRAERAEAQVETLREALRRAGRRINQIHSEGFDSRRREVAAGALREIDDVLASPVREEEAS